MEAYMYVRVHSENFTNVVLSARWQNKLRHKVLVLLHRLDKRTQFLFESADASTVDIFYLVSDDLGVELAFVGDDLLEHKKCAADFECHHFDMTLATSQHQSKNLMTSS